MRGDFEAYLNDSFRDENGNLDLAALLALEDEADMDVAVIMPNTQPLPENNELADAIRVIRAHLVVPSCIQRNQNPLSRLG